MAFIPSGVKKLLAVFIVYVAVFMLVEKFSPTFSAVRILGLPSVLWYLTFLNYGMLIVLASIFAWIVVPQLMEKSKAKDVQQSGKEVSS